MVTCYRISIGLCRAAFAGLWRGNRFARVPSAPFVPKAPSFLLYVQCDAQLLERFGSMMMGLAGQPADGLLQK